MNSLVATKWLEEMACPRCAGALSCQSDILACPSCRQQWPIRDGVPHFISDFPYWGEVSRQSMIQLNQKAGTDWKSALIDSDDPEVQRASGMVLNLARANWCLLTEMPRNSRVLDLGAGMGTTSHCLALRYREVVAVEPVAERVEFMQRRFEQERLENVRIVRSSLWEVPFEAGSFDMIAMNGVLEWVAVGRSGDPRKIQQTALRNAVRLLRPGGVLYVGIENRFCPGYFIGYRDPHCSAPWVTVLPRRLAHALMRRNGHPEGYRNYLYSASGYRRLLRQAGFSEVQCYIALPSYNHPRYYLPAQTNVLRQVLRNFDPTTRGLRAFLRSALLELGLLKHMQYSFALLATK